MGLVFFPLNLDKWIYIVDFHVSGTNLICKKYIVLQLCSGTADKTLVALAQQVKNCSFLTNSGGVAQNIPSQRNKCNKGRLFIIFYIKNYSYKVKVIYQVLKNKSRNSTGNYSAKTQHYN